MTKKDAIMQRYKTSLDKINQAANTTSPNPALNAIGTVGIMGVVLYVVNQWGALDNTMKIVAVGGGLVAILVIGYLVANIKKIFGIDPIALINELKNFITELGQIIPEPTPVPTPVPTPTPTPTPTPSPSPNPAYTGVEYFINTLGNASVKIDWTKWNGTQIKDFSTDATYLPIYIVQYNADGSLKIFDLCEQGHFEVAKNIIHADVDDVFAYLKPQPSLITIYNNMVAAACPLKYACDYAIDSLGHDAVDVELHAVLSQSVIDNLKANPAAYTNYVNNFLATAYANMQANTAAAHDLGPAKEIFGLYIGAVPGS